MKLMRFNANFAEKKFIALEDYIAKMNPTSEKIYFIVGSSIE